MFHSLKSLYQHFAAHSPEAAAKFINLKDYCDDADEVFHAVNLNRGHRSLKWAIYSLREKIEQSELEALFVSLCNEAALKNCESDLYDDILSFYAIRRYLKMLERPKFDLGEFDVRQIGKWRLLVNDSGMNLTSFIFNKNFADIIVFRNEDMQSAGVVFRAREGRNGGKTGILDDFDVPRMFIELSKRGEGWKLGKEGNLLACGGFKAPENRTTITTKELVQLIERHRFKNYAEIARKEANNEQV